MSLPFRILYRTIAVVVLSLFTRLPAARALEPGVVTLVSSGACWRYLDLGLDAGIEWTFPGYDDGTWFIGDAELGYGDGDEATVVNFGPDANNKYITTYFRRMFYVPDPATFTNVVLRLKRDDGAAVYLNGVEVFRSNLPPGPLNYLTLASGVASDDGTNFITANLSPSVLQEGDNFIAVEIHQATNDDPDISFDLGLVGEYAGAPVLSVASSAGNNIVLSWPASASSSFVLQSAASLSGPFITVSNPVVVSGSFRYVTNAITPATRFYRLYAAVLSLPPCQPPIVTSQPLRVEVPQGTDTNLTVIAVGTGPITYDWRKNQRSANGTNSTLTLTNLQRAMGGGYDVLICNPCACGFSCPIVLVVGGTNVVLADNFADRASFTADSAWLNSSNSQATLEAGEPVNPSASYGRTVWLEWTAPTNGIAVFDTRGSAVATTIAVYTGNSLTNLLLETYGGLHDRAFNSRVVFNAVAGTAYQIQLDGIGPAASLCVNWEFTETTNAIPQIILQPQSEYVHFASNGAFTVAATLPPPLTNSSLTYQWFKEGVPLGGATSASLPLPSVSISNIAQYFAVISHGSLNTTSDVVNLVGLDPVLGTGSISPPFSSYGGQYYCGSTPFAHHLLYYFRTPNTTPDCARPCNPGGTIAVDPYFQPVGVTNDICTTIDVSQGDCGGGPAAATRVTYDTILANASTVDTALLVQRFTTGCNVNLGSLVTSDNISGSDKRSSVLIPSIGGANISTGFIKVFLLYKGTVNTPIQLNYKYCP